MANRVLGVASRIFSFALDRGLIEAHPCFRLRKPGREGKRERVLSEDEIRKLWKAWEQMAFPFGYLFQLLLVTAQRRGEGAEMTWADIDLDERVWRMARTKAGHGNEVPLSPLAHEIIERIPRQQEWDLVACYRPLVFTTNGKTTVSGFSKAAAAATKLSGATGWTIHDLRRTAATFMARLGIPKLTISRVLNHAEGGVTSLYARHGYLGEKRDALEPLGNPPRATLEGRAGRSGSNVERLVANEELGFGNNALPV